MDKELLKLVPVNEDEKLNAMLRNHQQNTGLDYCDDAEILSYSFNSIITNHKAADEAHRIVRRINRKK